MYINPPADKVNRFGLISRSTALTASAILPQLLLALPFGIPNSLTQVLALIFVLPFLLLSRLNATYMTLITLFFLLIISNSIYQALLRPNSESSYYQMARSLTPFFILCSILINYKLILSKISQFILTGGQARSKKINRAIDFFALLCAVQSVGFMMGLPTANYLSASGSGERVMIFMSTSCVFLMYYTTISKRHWSTLLFFMVVLGTGSKSILVASVLIFLLAASRDLRAINFLGVMASGTALIFSLYFINPLALDRVMDFASSEQGESFKDATRAYEIFHAHRTMNEYTSSVVFGSGFATQLTPGVPTSNSAWFENSKYDIENGYWGIFSKLGVVLTAIFVIIIIKFMPLNRVLFAIILVEAPLFFKTSYQVFAYMDGVYLIIWSILVNALLLSRKSYSLR
ncbi:hypothetical protein [Gemmobacter sp. 24YEA27]|uniref:hypothetical protein n=1 Tax=Gemmobacter sp. 24YEA27 TaxID=3040672 RepID=UPI0024B368EF|nr:hypothetical protein [Gemmobacter sp. 24YEA27]